jgi:hypothetical protein
MKIVNAIVEYVMAKQAARKERRHRQYAADAYADHISTDYRSSRNRRYR